MEILLLGETFPSLHGIKVQYCDFIEYINACTEIFDEDYDEELWFGDEGWEDEAAKFYGYNPDDFEDDDSLPF